MPTVILVDNSFSMCRPVPEDPQSKNSDDEIKEVLLRKDMALVAIHRILDHLEQTNKYEFVSVIKFSGVNDLVQGFTRDYSLIKASLLKSQDGDLTSLGFALSLVCNYCKEVWGTKVPCQVLVITDGSPGVGYQKHMKYASGPRTELSQELSELASLDILCLASENESALQSSMKLYQKYIDFNGNGFIYVPKGKLTMPSLFAALDNYLNTSLTPYKGTLHVGKLSSPITLAPPPQTYTPQVEASGISTNTRLTVSEQITVLGFISIVDVSSPPAFSRHLLLPVADSPNGCEASGDEENVSPDEGKNPNLCVLLHGGLKKESVVALCQVAHDWYGIIYFWADSKKKSNLLLSLFEPGTNVVPWLGNLSELGPNSQTPTDTSLPHAFPIKTAEKRSYNQACVVWVRSGGLQSDVQKILRHARKLPDKNHSFYKELNGVKKAALQYGFPELLKGICSVLEREIMTLPSNYHPEASMQLQHACTALNVCAEQAMDPNNKDTKHHANIQQLKTSYSSSD